MTDQPRVDRAKRRVVCAAIEKQGIIVCGPRHFDLTMHAMIRRLADEPRAFADAEQGFVDQWGEFMTRQEAYKVAEAAGQIRGEPNIPGTLFSEDLY